MQRPTPRLAPHLEALARLGCPRTARRLEALARRRRPPTELERAALLRGFLKEAGDAGPHCNASPYAEAWPVVRCAFSALGAVTPSKG